jgi:hypothetical protein
LRSWSQAILITDPCVSRVSEERGNMREERGGYMREDRCDEMIGERRTDTTNPKLQCNRAQKLHQYDVLSNMQGTYISL